MIFRFTAVFFLLAAVFGGGPGEGGLHADAGEVPPRMRVLDNAVPLQVGDRLSYRVLEEREPAVMLFVNSMGEVNVPLVGRVSALNRTPYELALELKRKLEVEYFFTATVVIEAEVDREVRGRVNVVGEVRTRGAQPLPADATIRLSEMILRSGGFTAEADQNNVRLIRQGGRGPRGELVEAGTYTYDVRTMLESGDFADDPYLISNDVILVPRMDEIGGEFLVLGAVNREGAYRIDQRGMTVSRAILAAGGFSRFAQDRRVRLIRQIEETGENKIFQINVRNILEGRDLGDDLEVQNGDIIRVDERMINF